MQFKKIKEENPIKHEWIEADKETLEKTKIHYPELLTTKCEIDFPYELPLHKPKTYVFKRSDSLST